jgi:choline-sulfatase
MNFFEGSARVPLMIHAPGRFEPRAVDTPTSLLDIAPTLIELAGGSVADLPTPLDGTSLAPLASGRSAPAHLVRAEYAAEASIEPMVMLREGPFKFIHAESDPDMLFDLVNDPEERINLAADPVHAPLVAHFHTLMSDRWNLSAFKADVLASQARRRLVYEALRKGSYYPWDFQPLQKASERYMRNHMDLNVLEASARFPPAGE